MIFKDIYLLIAGRKFRAYDSHIQFEARPDVGYAKLSMCAYISNDAYNDLAKLYNDGTPSGTVINDEIRPEAVSFEDWVKSIAKGKDVYLPSDILLKALKEYFDKILTTNDKE